MIIGLGDDTLTVGGRSSFTTFKVVVQTIPGSATGLANSGVGTILNDD